VQQGDTVQQRRQSRLKSGGRESGLQNLFLFSKQISEKFRFDPKKSILKAKVSDDFVFLLFSH